MLEPLLGAYQAWPLLFWVAGSILVYLLASNAAWWVKRVLVKSDRRLPARGGWLVEVCAFLFFIGIPYLALGGWPLPPFSGLLSMADMGVAGLGGDWHVARWLESAGTGLALSLAGVIVLGAGWGAANRGGSQLGLPAQGVGYLLARGLAQEIHWSFYRAALAATILSTPALNILGPWAVGNVYAGTWAALALVLFEWSLNPAWRATWRDPARAGRAWLGVGLALLSTLVFLLTRNLWICIAVHWLVAATLTAIARRPSLPTVMAGQGVSAEAKQSPSSNPSY
ncbi:MAG: hypothetical protein JXA93_15800 [Anaerolineae bacterium]|nr:hypothetical protein [Anaerolineae bacterium]